MSSTIHHQSDMPRASSLCQALALQLGFGGLKSIFGIAYDTTGLLYVAFMPEVHAPVGHPNDESNFEQKFVRQLGSSASSCFVLKNIEIISLYLRTCTQVDTKSVLSSQRHLNASSTAHTSQLHLWPAMASSREERYAQGVAELMGCPLAPGSQGNSTAVDDGGHRNDALDDLDTRC